MKDLGMGIESQSRMTTPKLSLFNLPRLLSPFKLSVPTLFILDDKETDFENGRRHGAVYMLAGV
jgi:hypothetical protein